MLAFIVVTGLIFWLVPDLFSRCLGHETGEFRNYGRGTAVVLLVGEMACSWVLLTGPRGEIALFLALLGSLAALLWAWRWTRRHQAFWAPIRARERAQAKERRAKRRREREAAKALAKAAAAGDPPAVE